MSSSIPRRRHRWRKCRWVGLYRKPLGLIDILGTRRGIEDGEGLGLGLGLCGWRAGDAKEQTGSRRSGAQRADAGGARRTRTTASEASDRARNAAARAYRPLACRSDDCDMVFFHAGCGCEDGCCSVEDRGYALIELFCGFGARDTVGVGWVSVCRRGWRAERFDVSFEYGRRG